MIKILETNQFIASGDIETTKLEDWEADAESMLQNVKGGDAEASRKISGGWAQVREVDENKWPSIGFVWFKPDESGLLRKWRANYDSSG